MADQRVTESRPRGRRRLPPEERRAQLISAAITLFSTRAFDQVSIDDIAAEADVSRALFYRYFSSPHDVFLAATATAIDGLIARLTAPGEGSLIEQLRAALREFVLFARAHGATFVALLRNGSVMASADTDALIDRVRLVAIDEIILRCRIADPSPLTLMTLRSWVATVEVGTLSWVQEGHLTEDELVSWLIAQLTSMMAATAVRDAALSSVLAELDLGDSRR